jgi:C1q domain
LGLRPTPSAFRALSSAEGQNIPPGVLTKLVFPREVFDLNNEYDPATSTFVPQQSGIYTIITNVFSVSLPPSEIGVGIRVNDTIVEPDFDEEESSNVSSTPSLSLILQLQAGDRVDVAVFALVSSGSNIVASFQAVREA